MRIGYVHVDYEEWTDGQYNVQEIGLAKAFEELGHETVIVYWVKSGSSKCFTQKKITEKIKKVYLPTLHFRHHVVYHCNLLKRLNLDLVHIQSDNLFYVPQLARWCRRNHIPYYCYVGTIESSNPSKAQKLLMDILVKRNLRTYRKSIVFTKTQAMADQLKRNGVRDPIVAPVGLDLSVIPEISESREELRNSLGLSLDKKVVVCVCALRPDKRPMDVFDFSQLLDDRFEIVHIGDGPMRSAFEEQARRAGERLRFHHIPKLPNTQIHRYYRCADYFVNFNPEEIFGMAILEAMYQNCTVVARHAPGPDFIIEDGKSGYLADSVGQMAEIVSSGCTCGQIPRQRILDSFLWDSTAKKILNNSAELRVLPNSSESNGG